MSEQGAFGQLWARVASAIGFGVITATTALERRGVRRAQVRFSEAEIRDNTPLVGLYGVASRPLDGAHAVLVFPAGDRSQGLIIATNDARYQIELAPGEVALHTDEGDSIHLKRGRVVRIVAGTKLEIDTPVVTVTGRVEVAGDVKAGTVSLKTHKHKDVRSGTDQSGPPVA